MDEWVDDNRGQTQVLSRMGLRSKSSLTLNPAHNPGALDQPGQGAFRALVESVFWVRAGQRWLTDGMLRDLWNGMQFQFRLSLDSGKGSPKICSPTPPAQVWDPTILRGP